MALEAGELSLQLHFGQHLKSKDWFGKQDPYCILTCGDQELRSCTAVDGGRNPVWNEILRFTVLNENDIGFVVMDEDTLLRDDVIGQGRISLAKARMEGRDHMQVPVHSKKSGKQHGTISISLTFTRKGEHGPRSGSNGSSFTAASAVLAAPYPIAPVPYVPPVSAPPPVAAPYTPKPLPAPIQLPPPATMINSGAFHQHHQHMPQHMPPPAQHSGPPPLQGSGAPGPMTGFPAMGLPPSATGYPAPAMATGLPAAGLPAPAMGVPVTGIPAPPVVATGLPAAGHPAAGYGGAGGYAPLLAPQHSAPAPIAITSQLHQPVFYALHAAVTAAHAHTPVTPQVIGYPSLYTAPSAGYSLAGPLGPTSAHAHASTPHLVAPVYRTLAAAT